MAEVICDTSPLQYLHQLGELRLLPALAGRVVVPPAVVDELTEGRAHGVDLPRLDEFAWIEIRSPISAPATALLTDLGPGETQVLMLALETPGAVVVLDDAHARAVAEARRIRLIGTLGLLLDAKRSGLISAVKPYLEQLQALRFRLAAHTRAAVLKMSGESENR